MKKEKYDITGMTCSACSSRVEKSVSKLEGVSDISVNLLTNSMQVSYDENRLDSEKIINEVEKAGYGASIYGNLNKDSGINHETKSDININKDKHSKSESDSVKTRLIWSFIFLIPMMYVSMTPMFHHMFGLPIPRFMNSIFYGNENALAFSFVQFLLLLPILYLNQRYYKVGFKNLFHGSPNMDSLIAIGSGAAAVYGIFAIFRIGYGLGHGYIDIVNNYSGDLYFESAGMIVTLITLGKFFESKSKGKTSEAIKKLMDLAPKQATVIREGKTLVISANELLVDDIVVVKPGESLAADGVIVEGRTSIDESAITGESIPVEKQIGDKVIAATLNKAGTINFRAQKVGEDTTISQIIHLVDEASGSKAPIAKMADKIAGIFVPIVIIIAILTSIIWFISGAGFEFSLSVGISVLVISCPCALGLATPVAIMVGTGKGAENGILIKSGEALEIAHSIDTVVMDKTGTITQGKPQVTDVIAIDIDEKSFISIAAGIEVGSEHPLAEAIVSYADKKSITASKIQEFEAVFGRGVSGRYNNKQYIAGNEALMADMNIELNSYKKTIDMLADEGKTPLIFAEDNRLIGIIAVADIEKESSKLAISIFEKMNIDVVMLTGDNKKTAEAIRKRLGISKVIAEVMPDEKEKYIAKLQGEGHKVAMIGDGINDAPALARANLGMAIGAGTDIAIESADAILVRNDLLDAVSAVRLSKSVIRNIKENLFWAFFYNSIGIPLAAGVLYPAFGIKLSPMFGAAAMSLSSVCVVLNALRLRWFKTNHRDSSIESSNSESNNSESNNSELNQEKLNQEKLNQEELDKREMEKDNMENEVKKEMEYELVIEGMMCEHCQKNVEKALMAMKGVTKATVDLSQKKAFVKADSQIEKDDFDRTIIDAGYELIRLDK